MCISWLLPIHHTHFSKMLQAEDSSVLWLVVLGFIIAFVLAFGIGANDVANSFGTSVGSKVLTLFQACIIASIFELGGAILIGSKVSDTVRKGIIDINGFEGSEELAMVGAFSALTGTSVWLLIATFFALPVSGTHSIVGATIGYGLVAFGGSGITWPTFGKIAASWIISPLLSGLMSSLIFILINKFILTSSNPLFRGLLALPFLFAATIFINLFSIFYSSSEVFGMENLKWFEILAICIGCAILIGILTAAFLNPWLKRRILYEGSLPVSHLSASFKKNTSFNTMDQVEVTSMKKIEGSVHNQVFQDETCRDEETDEKAVKVQFNEEEVNPLKKDDKIDLIADSETDNGLRKKRSESTASRSRSGSVRSRTKSVIEDIMMPVDETARSKIQDDPHSARLFKYLQILTASFGAFAHGGNDVSNAIGPVISLWLIYQNGEVVSKASTPIWILIYGGVGIILGLCLWGQKVIKTIGENLSPITPSSGFAIEIGSALTVLLASNLGIPVSTTHCKVGSVVFVGRVRAKEVVDWSLFGNIVLSWVVTMPITGGISAALFAILREVLY